MTATRLLPGAWPSGNAILRLHWTARHRLARRQREQVAYALRAAGVRRGEGALCGAAECILVRHGARKLDGDNLQLSCKSARDAVAEWLHLDDGDPRWTWTYLQVPARRVALQIDVTLRPIAHVETMPIVSVVG